VSALDKPLPPLVDLFCGCGGLSWGFKEAGFPLSACVDLSPSAVANLRANTPSGSGMSPAFVSANISHLNPTDFAPKSSSGCVVVGGPPCQAYSRIGRGKLRSLGEQRAHTNDLRGRLYEEFVLFAESVGARAIVMENVLDSISYGGDNIPELICGDLEQMGYAARWSVLNAADFGVPQVRERVILIAIRTSEGFQPQWPVPTHFHRLDQRGFSGFNFAEIKKQTSYFVPSHRAVPEGLLPWVTVDDALSDLPNLRLSFKDQYVQYKLNQELPYKVGPSNAFQSAMRSRTSQWVGTTGHAYRNTPRDWPIFEKMAPGDNYLDASRIADRILEETCLKLCVSEGRDGELYAKLKRKLVPPYDREKFYDKWKRLDPNRPSHTLVAHLGVDTYSHIHPCEPRGISVREAARLQSFPDEYLFWGSMGDSFKQIGNAVPPLLSLAVARVLAAQFREQNRPIQETEEGV